MLHGRMPYGICGITNLGFLNLAQNKLQGLVPRNWVCMNLTKASLAGDKDLGGGSVGSRCHLKRFSVNSPLLNVWGLASVGLVLFIFSVFIVLKIWTKQSMLKNCDDLGDSRKLNSSDDQNLYFLSSSGTKEPLIINIAAFEQHRREFLAEMEILGKVQPRDLVTLLGYCSYGPVYEYMTNGSLDHWLRSRTGTLPILDRSKRFKVTLGSSRGMVFFPRDTKASSNILVDEEFESKGDDFGLARLFSACETHMSTAIAGIFEYIPLEYGQSRKSTARGDRYNFGVILLELLIGKETAGLITEVKPIEIHHKAFQESLTGDVVGFTMKKVAVKDLKCGCVVLNSKENLAKEAANFTPKVIIMNRPGQSQTGNGYAPVLDCHTSHTGVKFAELLTKIMCSSKELEKETKFLKNEDACMIKDIEGGNLVGWVFLKSKNGCVVYVIDSAILNADSKPKILETLLIVGLEYDSLPLSPMLQELLGSHHLEDKVDLKTWGNDTPMVAIGAAHGMAQPRPKSRDLNQPKGSEETSQFQNLLPSLVTERHSSTEGLQRP